MRAILGFGLAVLLVAAAGASADDKVDAKKLVGKWEPQGLPAGAKATVEFTKDGKLLVNFGFGDKTDKSEGTYKVEGNKLTVELKDRKTTQTITKLTDEDLAFKEDTKDGKNGKEETFKRVKDKKK